MEKKLSFEEQMIRRYTTDRYHWIVGGWINEYSDNGCVEGTLTIENLIEEISDDLLKAKRNIRLECGLMLEPKHIRFIGKERVIEIVRKRVERLYKEEDGGCWPFEK